MTPVRWPRREIARIGIAGAFGCARAVARGDAGAGRAIR